MLTKFFTDMTKLIFCKDEETKLIKDIPTLSQKSPGFDSDSENSEIESEYAYNLNKSDSEYFPSSDSSDNELSTSCSPEPSKSETSDDDIFPSIPKIYPRTY